MPVATNLYPAAHMSLLAGDEKVTQYIPNVQKIVRQSQNQAQPITHTFHYISLHTFSPGDKVWIKVHKRNNGLSTKWERPYLVLLASFSAIKLEG